MTEAKKISIVQDAEDLEIVRWTVNSFKELDTSFLPTDTRTFHPVLKSGICVPSYEEDWLASFIKKLYSSHILTGIELIEKERGLPYYGIPDFATVLAVGAISKIGLEARKRDGIVRLAIVCGRAKKALEKIDSSASEVIRGDLLKHKSLKRDFAIASPGVKIVNY